MRRRWDQIGPAVFLATFIQAGVAGAQDGPPVDSDAAPADPGDAAADESGDAATAPADDPAVDAAGPIAVLPRGGFLLHGRVGVGMSKEILPGFGGSGNPVVIAPDVWYGATDTISVGLTHSPYGQTGFWSGVFNGLYGSSLCVSGDACLDEIYSTGGLQAIVEVARTSTTAIAPVGGVFYNVVDPLRIGLGVGVMGLWTSGPLTLNFTPNIYVGLNEREGNLAAGQAPNNELVSLPLSVTYAVSLPLRVGIQTGVQGVLDGFGDNYMVPVGLNVQMYLSPALMVGGAFVFERVLGGTPVGLDYGATDLRSLSLYVEWMK